MLALERMRELTLQIILRVVFGARDDELTALRRAIDDTLATVRSLPSLLAMAVVRKDLGPQSPWGRFRVAVERFDAILFELLARRRERTGEDDSMLAVLLDQRDEHGNPPSDRNLRDQLVALLVGGHDESAASLAWAFERLARYPEVQARLGEGDPAYLDAVVKEALRLRPVIPGVGRVVRGEPFRLGDYVIPPGVEINPSIRMIHGRADLYPEPTRFRPERFLGPDAPDTYTWLPFGGGVRRCLGASFAQTEMRIVLRRVLQRTALRPASPKYDKTRSEGSRWRPRTGSA